MISAVSSVEIDRPVSEVFRFVADPANESTWHTDIVHARLEPPGTPGPDRTLHATFRTMGRTSQGIADVATFEPDRRIVYRFRTRTMGMEPTLTYSFDAAGSRTRFTRRIDLVPHGVMRLAGPIVGGLLRGANARFAGNLKRHLETAR